MKKNSTLKDGVPSQPTDMERNLQSYLLDIAREEATSIETELHSLRNSLRYRVGGWMLEAFPPGGRTLVVLWRLVGLSLARLRGRGVAGNAGRDLVLPEVALQRMTLVLGPALPEEVAITDGIWRTDNAELMARRLDSGAPANTLILRLPASPLLRRLERAKLAGTKVIWWPEASVDFEPALVNYVRGHADECRDELSA